MSPEIPSDPREALEVSLTALVLGELPEDQAAFVRQAIAVDADLARRFDRLKQSIEFVRLAEVTVAQPTEPPPVLKLSDRRRQELLAAFKTVTPEFDQGARQRRWLIPAGIAALLLACLGVAALLPALSRSKSGSLAAHLGVSESQRRVDPGLLERTKKLPSSSLLSAGDPGKKLAIKEQPVAQVQASTKIVLPAAGTELAYASSQLGPQAEAGRLGGTLPPLATADGRIVPALTPDSAPLVEGLERKLAAPAAQPSDTAASASFLRRYGLATQAAPGNRMSGGKPIEAAQGSLAEAAPDANSLVAGQRASIAQPWSVNAGPATTAIFSPITPTEAAPASAGVAFVPGQMNNDPGQGTSPSLGDQPSFGYLFSRPSLPQNELLRSNGLASTAAAGLPSAPGVEPRAPQIVALDQIKAGETIAPRGTNQRFALYVSDPDQDGLLNGLLNQGTSDRSIVASQDQTFTITTGRKDVAQESARRYAEKSRELAELEVNRQQLLLKSASESADVAIPKTTPVTIVDQAVPAEPRKPGLLDRIAGKSGGDFESVARVRLAPEKSLNSTFYDSYFPQTESEVIRSDRVLGRVVDKLGLREEFAKQKGDQKLDSQEAINRLRQDLTVQVAKGTGLLEIRARDDQAEQASKIANTVAQEYQSYRVEQARAAADQNVDALQKQIQAQEQKIASVKTELEQLRSETNAASTDAGLPKAGLPAPVPQPEIQTRENAFSTFSLNVSDVSFKLAAASLENGALPEPAGIRAEEFINAFDYRDPEPAAGAPFAFAWERARYSFAHNRDLLRLSLKTASQGRQPGKPLNLVLLLDTSGSMERADRVRIVREALRVLAAQLQPQDTLSVVTFARTARLWVDGVTGDRAGQVLEQLGELTPQGGTNLEEAMNLGYQTALRHYRGDAINRVVLLTDGAANLGDVDAGRLKLKVETHRKQGIALDCFGIGWEGYDDDLLEVLSRNGDGRYGFINSAEEASSGFASQLAGALHVAASDVKVQVEFNPERVTAYRQIGYAKHQLTKEQFRDNTVDAAELGSAECGNALYVIETDPGGAGPLATVRVRFKVPGTSEFQEHAWAVPYTGNPPSLEGASPALRLAGTAGAFAEWLSTSPYATEMNPDSLLRLLTGVSETYGADPRPPKLEWMIRQAKSLTGK